MVEFKVKLLQVLQAFKIGDDFGLHVAQIEFAQIEHFAVFAQPLADHVENQESANRFFAFFGQLIFSQVDALQGDEVRAVRQGNGSLIGDAVFLEVQ